MALAALCLVLALASCGHGDRVLTQDEVQRVLLTETELPGSGWTLVEATTVAPTAGPTTPLATGPCEGAIGLIDEIATGATAFAKASYTTEGQPALELMALSFAEPPDRFTRIRDLVAACPQGVLNDQGREAPFTLTAREYPESGATGASLTVLDAGQPHTLEVAVLIHGGTVVAGVATGLDSEATHALLRPVMAAQADKLP